MYRTLLVVSGLILAAPAPPPSFKQAPPTQAGSEYRLVFSDEFDNPATVGEAPGAPHAQWYRTAFFGGATTPASSVRIANGVLSLQGQGNRPATLVTAGPANNGVGWSGAAIRGGAYIEARIAVGPHERSSGGEWPSFFGMSVEHLGQRGAAEWPGRRPGTMRFIENDFFEYDPRQGTANYAASLHEWYGRWGVDCGAGKFCSVMSNRMIPVRDGFRRFHTVGQLWVPATDGRAGFIQNFLDGAPVGEPIEWRGREPGSYPATGFSRFNVIDRHGLALILSTGGLPLEVDWVRVWQRSGGRIERR
jgi:hypothetical protein